MDVSLRQPSASAVADEQLGPDDFTQLFAAYYRHAAPHCEVEVIDSLHLRIRGAHETRHTNFLDNAYREYLADPTIRDEILERFLAASLESLLHDRSPIDRHRIVPVVKPVEWLEEIRSSVDGRGPFDDRLPLCEPYNEALTVAYAEDGSRSIRYLNRDTLRLLDLDSTELAELARANLTALLPPLEITCGDGLHLVTADGAYESSLILLESLWGPETFDVEGDIVVALPSRDLLLVTGSQDTRGLARARRITNELSEQRNYLISRQLFRLSDGRFEPFREPTGS